MTRPVKFLLWFLAAMAVGFVILAVLLATFDWNRLKPTINERVSDALERPFAINGDLAVDWRRAPPGSGWRALLPWPHVSAESLTLGNPQWAQSDYFVAARRVDFVFSPWALLGRRIDIPRIDFTGPSANLERREDGRANWSFERDEPQTEDDSGWRFDIGEIGFDQGRIDLNDEVLDARVELELDPLGEPIPVGDVAGSAPRDSEAPRDSGAGRAAPQSYALGWQAKGRYQGQPLKGEGKVGGLLALQDSEKPFPLQVDLSVGKTRIALAGTLSDPRELGALDLDLALSGESMSELYPLIGVTLPDTPAYSTDGRLTARLREPAGSVYRYENFTGEVGQSDLNGTLVYTASEPRPKLSGTLGSKQLRFADLGPLIGVDGDSEDSPQPPDKALPVQEFRTDRWRAMDADVKFAGERIVRGDALPINDLDTHVVLEDGLLRLEPLRFGMAGGRLDIDLRLDGRKTPMTGQLQLGARGFKLKEMFPTFEPMQTSLGELNAQAELAGRGNSVAELLGNANGEASMLINDGIVSRALMELVGLNLGRYVVTELFEDDEVRINCAAADLGVKDGVMSTRLFLFDTENATVYVDGTADLEEERLDLNIRPRSKGMRLLSFRSPLYVRGTFKEPDAGVQAGSLVARGAGMLALGAAAGPLAALLALIGPAGEEGNQCVGLLEGIDAGDDAPKPEGGQGSR